MDSKPSSNCSDPFGEPTTDRTWALFSKLRNAKQKDVYDHFFGEIIKRYRAPIHYYVCRKGFSKEDADDITQEFLLMMHEKKRFQATSRGEGRMRAWILIHLRNFVCNEFRKRHALKREGGAKSLSLDASELLTLDALERECLSESAPSDALFDLRWAKELFNRAFARLEAEFAAEGRVDRFAILRPHMGARAEYGIHDELAARLGMDVGAVKTQLSRMNKRFRERLLEEINDTVADVKEAEMERDYIIQLLTQPERRTS